MPKGLGEGRKGSWETVIYYRLSLFVILLLRFMVSPKSSSARRARPSRQVGLWAAAIPQAAAALPQVPGARGCHWILKRFLLSPCLRSSHFSSHPGYHFILHTCPAWKRWIVLNNGVITTEWQEQRDPAGSLGLGVIRREKKKKRQKYLTASGQIWPPLFSWHRVPKRLACLRWVTGSPFPAIPTSAFVLQSSLVTRKHWVLIYELMDMWLLKEVSSEIRADEHVTLERNNATLGRFILFVAMVSGIVSFISLSDLSLFVYRNARDFCVLILQLY